MRICLLALCLGAAWAPAQVRDPLITPTEEVLLSKGQSERLVFQHYVRTQALTDNEAIGRLIVAYESTRQFEVYRNGGVKSLFVSPEKQRMNIAEALSEYQRRARLLRSTEGFEASPRLNRMTHLAIDVLGEKFPGVEKAKPFLKGGATEFLSLYDALQATKAQQRVKDEFSAQLDLADKLSGELFDFIVKHPEYREEIFGKSLKIHFSGIEPGKDDVTEMLDKTPPLRESLRSAYLYKWAKGTDALLRDSIDPKTKQLLISMKKLQEQQEKLLKAQTDQIKESREKLAQLVADAVEPLKRKFEREEEARRERQERELAQFAVTSSLQLFSALASHLDPKLGQMVQTTGAAGIQIANAIERYVEAGESTVGAVIMTTNIIGAFYSIASLAFGGTADIYKALSTQIHSLRLEVDAMRREMHDWFQRIDRNLITTYVALSEKLAGLEIRLARFQVATAAELGAIRGDILAVQSSLSDLSTQMTRFEKSMHTYLTAGFERRIFERRDECLDTTLSPEGFSTCLTNFKTCAVTHAPDPLASGYDPGVDAEALVQTYAVLYKELKKSPTAVPLPYESQVNLIAAVARALGSPVSTPGTLLASPVLWSLCTETYLSLARRCLSQYPQTSCAAKVGPELAEIGAVGHRTREALTALAFRDDAGTVKSNSPLFGMLLDHYEALTKRLHSLFTLSARSYRIPGSESHYNLWRFDSRETKYEPPLNAIRPPTYEKEWPSIAAPVDLWELVPTTLRAAQDLGRGVVEFRYYQVSFDDIKEESREDKTSEFQFKTTTTRKGRLRVSIVGLYDKRPFLWTSVAMEKPIAFHEKLTYRSTSPGLQITPPPSEKTLLSPLDALKQEWELSIKPRVVSKGEPFHTRITLTRFLKEHDGGNETFSKLLPQGAASSADAWKELFWETARTVKLARTSVLEELERQKVAFNDKLAREISNSSDPEVSETLDAISGVKTLLEAFLVLGLPRTYEADDALRSFFTGSPASALPDREVLLKLYRDDKLVLFLQPTRAEKNPWSIDLMAAQGEALRQTLKRRLERIEPEVHPGLDDMLLKMRAMSRAFPPVQEGVK